MQIPAFSRLNKQLLALAAPNILTNITVPLLSTADVALMGRISEAHLGAVGLAGMVFNFLYWNFSFLRSGTAGLTAQAFGAEDRSRMIHTLLRAVGLSLFISAWLLALQGPLGKFGFELMQVRPEQAQLVNTYFYIRILGLPAGLAITAITGWFLGMQNAIYPLLLTIFISLINIGGNFFFVYGLEMHVDGVAWATVISQYAGLLLALGLFFGTSRYRSLSREIRLKTLKKLSEFTHFLRLNRDLFIRTFLLSSVFAFVYSQSSAEGEMALAVNTVLMQFLNWMSFGVDGFAFAAESLIGRYIGARDEKTARKVLRLSFLWGMGMALGYSLVYGFGGNALLGLFTNDPAVMEAARPYLIWMVAVPLIGTPCYIWDGVFIGLTASRALRDTMVIAVLAFAAVMYFYGLDHGLHGLWLGMCVFFAGRGISETGYFLRSGFGLK